MSVYLPAQWVAAGRGLPDVCAAHGNPVADRRRTRIESAPPAWVWALLPLGLLIFFIVRAATRKAIFAAGWGFCGACRRTRVTRFIAGIALLGSGAVCLGVLAATADDPASRPGVLIGVGLLLIIAGYVALRISAGEVIARARLTRDGWYVEVRDPAPGFAAQARTTMAAAPQPLPW